MNIQYIIKNCIIFYNIKYIWVFEYAHDYLLTNSLWVSNEQAPDILARIPHGVAVIVFQYPSFRPATHPDLIGISRFFSTNLGVSRFPDSTCENPEFLFRFEIGKTKGRLTLLHGPCLQTHKVWAENKCPDRLNPLHTATQLVK